MPDSEIVARLEACLVRSEMGYSERYDADAERFYSETRFMAPGKSVPLEMASTQPDEERQQAWEAFSLKLRDEFHSMLRDTVAEIRRADAAEQALAEEIAVRDAMFAAVNGEPVSDFMLSFGIVMQTDDIARRLRANLASLTAQQAKLIEQWNDVVSPEATGPPSIHESPATIRRNAYREGYAAGARACAVDLEALR